MSDIPLDEVIHFDAITHNATTGAVTDADSTPTFGVYEESTDTEIGVGGNLTKRTALTGNYRGSFTASAANGFEIGKWYNVIGSATVNSVAGKAVVMRFRCVAAEALAGYPKTDIHALNGDTQSATDLKDFADAGYDPATNKVQGVVLVDTTTTLTNLPSITAGWLTAAGIAASALDGKGNWNIGKTGYTLTATTGLGNQTADITGSLSGSVGSVTGAVGSVTGAVGSVTGLTAANLDVAVSSRLATASYTAPPSAGTISTQVASDLAVAHGAGSWATATGFSTLSQADIRTAIGLAAANLDTQIGLLATAANLLVVSDGVGFITAVLMGACSDAGTAGETYVVTFGGATYTTDFTGLDATGNRTTTTRTKT